MQSFLLGLDPTKNAPSQKTTDPFPPSLNPFFQYVNTKSSVSSAPPKDQTQPKHLLQKTTMTSNLSENKIKNNPNDPRKPHNAPELSSQLQKILSNPQATQLETKYRDDLKQRRSRSREKKSVNRQRSEQNLKQKKEEHFHKTKLCPLYDKGQCKKGSECNFAHGYKQLRGLPNFYKTRLCLAFQKGQCRKTTSDCKYAHGEKQLRLLRHDAGYSSSISKSGNDAKTLRKEEKRNNYDQREKYRDDRREKEDRNRNKRDKDSDSINRKNFRESNHREESKDRKRKSEKNSENLLSYKKNIPLNQEYQKFLFAETELKVPPQINQQYQKFLYPSLETKTPTTHNSSYMVPGMPVYPPAPLNYQVDPYSINLRKDSDVPVTMPSSSTPSNLLPPISNYTDYEQNYKETYKNSSLYRDQNPPVYFQKSISQNKKTYSYPREKQESFQKNFPREKEGSFSRNFVPQNSYTPPPSNQFYYNAQYPPYLQNSSEPVPNFSKDSYQNLNKAALSDLPYEESRNFFLKQTKFPDSTYSQPQRSLMSAAYSTSQYDEKFQSFYKAESFYSLPSSKKQQNDSFSSFSGQSNYQANFASGQVYDAYPGLDPMVNQPVSFGNAKDKGRYSGFSNSNKR